MVTESLGLTYIVIGRAMYGENDLAVIEKPNYEEAVAAFKERWLADLAPEDGEDTEFVIEAVIEIMPKHHNFLNDYQAQILHHPVWGKLTREEVITIAS